MAKIKLGPNIVDIRGSIKEVIHTGWKRFGCSIKSRAGIYQNPQSNWQALVRSYVTEADRIWRDTLTPTQRSLWNEYASGLKPQTGEFGGNRNLIPQNRGIMSGWHAFVACYVPTRRCGLIVPAGFNDSPLGQTPPSTITDLVATWRAAYSPNFALDFDGVNEYVNFGNVLSYDYNQPQSWEFWVRNQEPTGSDGLVCKRTLVFNRGYQIWLSEDHLRWWIFRLSGAESIRVKRAFPSVGAWKHIVATYDGSLTAAGLKLYVDAVPGQVVDDNKPLTGTTQHTDPLRFAAIADVPSFYLTGQLDCMRNYNRVVTPAEVITLFNAGAGLYGADPFSDASCKGAWMFCVGEGNTLWDISGARYDGTLVNMEEGDWVPGKVPCPAFDPHILLTWSDPVVVTPDSVIRIWIRSQELGVHKQLIQYPDLQLEEALIYQVRMSQGAIHDITDFPGHYLIQADVIQPNGLKSPPSNTVEVTVP